LALAGGGRGCDGGLPAVGLVVPEFVEALVGTGCLRLVGRIRFGALGLARRLGAWGARAFRLLAGAGGLVQRDEVFLLLPMRSSRPIS